MLSLDTKLAMIDERAKQLLEQQYSQYLNLLAIKAQPETDNEREAEDRVRSMTNTSKAIAGLEAAIVALDGERMTLEREARRLPAGDMEPAEGPS